MHSRDQESGSGPFVCVGSSLLSTVVNGSSPLGPLLSRDKHDKFWVAGAVCHTAPISDSCSPWTRYPVCPSAPYSIFPV